MPQHPLLWFTFQIHLLLLTQCVGSTTSRICFSSDRVKCLIYSIKETALWLIFRVPQHVGPFNPTASSTRLTWSLRGETMQDLRSHSVISQDLNHPSIREVFHDSCNFPLLTLHPQGRSSINVLTTASIVSPLPPLLLVRQNASSAIHVCRNTKLSRLGCDRLSSRSNFRSAVYSPPILLLSTILSSAISMCLLSSHQRNICLTQSRQLICLPC